MKAFIVDNNSCVDDNPCFADQLKKHLKNDCSDVYCFTDFSAENVEELAKRLERCIGADDVIIININVKIGNGRRHEQSGIKLLKWLRLNNIYNHCVLYSFYSLKSLAKIHPSNTILLSKGVTFIQAPFLPSDIKVENLVEPAERENLIHFFRGEMDLKRMRHELANYYGLIKLIQSHQKVKPSFFLTSKTNSYFYKLSEWLFQDRSAEFEPEASKITTLNTYVNIIQIKKPLVIYLDDKANEGWGELLTDIVGNIKIMRIDENDTEDSLYTRFNFLKNGRIESDLFICDLRLKNSEADLSDYTKLVSYKLVKKIRNDTVKQKILYLTATNDLNKYKKILTKLDYNPQYIFTKEGVDQLYSPEASFNNYLEFVTFLFNLLGQQPPRIRRDYLQLFNKSEAEVISTLNEQIPEAIKAMVNPLYNPSSNHNRFDWIIFDTNAFMDKDYTIEILTHICSIPTSKIGIHKYVYAELERYENDCQVEFPLKSFLATYSIACFCEKGISRSNHGIQNLQVRRDVADPFLIAWAKDLAGSGQKVLFVSADYARGNGPMRVLERWIQDYKNKNLTLCTPANFVALITSPPPNNPVIHQPATINTPPQPATRLKIKWKICYWDKQTCTLKFRYNTIQKEIKIDPAKQNEFQRKFLVLKKGETSVELTLEKDGLYTVYELQKILDTPTNLN